MRPTVAKTTLLLVALAPTGVAVAAAVAPASKLPAALYYPARIENDVVEVTAPFEGVVTAAPAALGMTLKRGDRLFLVSNDNPAFNGKDQPVFAPVDSTVQHLQVRAGARVQVGTLLVTLALPNKRLVVELAAGDEGHVKIGQHVTFTPAASKEALAGKVIAISPTIDPVTNTLRCEIALSAGTRPERLTGGMVGEAVFELGTLREAALP